MYLPFIRHCGKYLFALWRQIIHSPDLGSLQSDGRVREVNRCSSSILAIMMWRDAVVAINSNWRIGVVLFCFVFLCVISRFLQWLPYCRTVSLFHLKHLNADNRFGCSKKRNLSLSLSYSWSYNIYIPMYILNWILHSFICLAMVIVPTPCTISSTEFAKMTKIWSLLSKNL